MYRTRDFNVIKMLALNQEITIPSGDADSESLTSFNKSSTNIEFNCGVVSTLNECTTKLANKLYIFDLVEKLKCSDQYDIGGTYHIVGSTWKPELWFYFSTSYCSDSIFLLNIFVYYENIGSFEIGISENNIITKQKTLDAQTFLSLPATLILKTLKSIEVDQSHHIISYCFTKDDLILLNNNNNNLCIPISINLKPKQNIDREVIWRVKRNHDLTEVFKKQENTDFTLKLKSGQKFETHKTLLAAHSQVIGNEIKKTRSNSLTVNITDSEMQLLLEYMYEGSIKDIHNQDLCKLIEMADKFKLDNLFKECEKALCDNISIANAVDIVILGEKYKLDKIQKAVFDFIKNNPRVLDTDSWKNMNDITVAKKFISEIFSRIT